jgi:hypothetical protein
MAYSTSDKPVVQTVPAARAGAEFLTLVTLLRFALATVFADDWIVAIVTSVLMAAFWSWGMILILPRVSKRITPSPRRIDPDQLPPAVGIWKANATWMVLTAVLWTAFVVFALFTHLYVVIGVFLGTPIIAWNEVRHAKRTEYEQHGVLCHTTGFAWTSKSRERYLVLRT